MRTLLVRLTVALAACAFGECDAAALHNVPPNAYVDHRVHLSVQDRDQVVQLIATRTSQHISSVWWGGGSAKIFVMCGYNDLVAGKHPMKGDAFFLQRTSSGWKITGQPNWSEVP
jgi:hypothetical protein